MMTKAEFSGNTLTVRFLIERLDMNVVRAVREEVIGYLNGKPSPVWIDMSNIAYMDSSGMGTLKMLQDHVRGYEGQLILSKINQPQMMLLKLSRLDTYFQFEEAQKPDLQTFD